MRLSTKGRYGLRAMIDLAVYQGEEPVSLQSIAERQSISEGYLEQIMAKLKKAGLVTSIRGVNGGYFLGKEARDISVGDILRALEGDLRAVTCKAQEKEGCANSDFCVSRYVWKKINDSIMHTVDTMYLEQLAQETKKLKEEQQEAKCLNRGHRKS